MDKSEIQQKTKILLKSINEPEVFIKGFQQLLHNNIDREKTKNYQRIIPDTGKFYGIPKPILWIIAREIGRFIQKESNIGEGLLRTLWKEGSFEAKQITAKSLEKFSSKHHKKSLDFISSILNDLDNWSVCDCLAMYGVEPIVYEQPELILPLSEEWIKNSSKWIRRFGVITLRGYKKIETTDKVFTILDLVMEDNDKDIKKAVAWVLREITKANPDEVAVFLTKWAKRKLNKDTRWIIKQGMKKLPEEIQKELLTSLS